MSLNEQTITIERIGSRLTTFFPDATYSLASISEALDEGDILYKLDDMLIFLQTALFDEKLVEVQFNHHSRVFFTRLLDEPPPLEIHENDDGTTELIEPPYVKGDYLKKLSTLVTLPIEPGIGNLHIRSSDQVVLRFFTSSYAVEFGVFFAETVVVRGIPALRFSFPAICRIVRGAREFRAKVPATLDLTVRVVGKRKQPSLVTKVVDISASGMSMALEKQQQELFLVDETRSLTIFLNQEAILRVAGKVRHVSKIRKNAGIEYVCGIQFDLVTRSIAAQVESVVAVVQRAHLKELSELSDHSGLNLIA